MFEVVKKHKGNDITRYGNGFTVFFEGEEVYFATIKEAEEFIDECCICNNEE